MSFNKDPNEKQIQETIRNLMFQEPTEQEVTDAINTIYHAHEQVNPYVLATHLISNGFHAYDGWIDDIIKHIPASKRLPTHRWSMFDETDRRRRR